MTRLKNPTSARLVETIPRKSSTTSQWGISESLLYSILTKGVHCRGVAQREVPQPSPHTLFRCLKLVLELTHQYFISNIGIRKSEVSEEWTLKNTFSFSNASSIYDWWEIEV
jgi:hypothetical protein